MLRFECYWRGIYLLFYYFNPDPRLIDSDFCKLELLKCLKFAGFLAHPVDLIFKFDYLYQTVQRWIHRLMKTITQQTLQTLNGNLIPRQKKSEILGIEILILVNTFYFCLGIIES